MESSPAPERSHASRRAPTSPPGTHLRWRTASVRCVLLFIVVLAIAAGACGGKDDPWRPFGCDLGAGDPRTVQPALECVATADDGARYAIWGYRNTATSAVKIALGERNRFVPTPASEGQPIVFEPGTHRHALVTPAVDGREWQLGGASARVGATSPTCLVVGATATVDGDPVALRPDLDVEVAGSIVDTSVDTPPRDQAPATTAGLTLQGDFSVTPDGVATYSVPLWVPAGRAGVQPRLSLDYSSRGGNGLLGVGWKLSGFSEIRRCPKSIAVDGESSPVVFARIDRFCLDGDALIEVSRGPAGTGIVEYRPEHDPFTRVRALGDEGPTRGPSSWEVAPRDGRIRIYGGTPTSRLDGRQSQMAFRENDSAEPVESKAPGYRVAWALSEERDRSGNALRVEYFNSAGCEGSGAPECALDNDSTYQLRPVAIRYAYGPLHPAATRSVRFVYDGKPRGDVEWARVAGVTSKIAVRLRRIEAWGPSPTTEKLLRSYRLTYNDEVKGDIAVGPSATRRSLLVRLQACDPADVCSKPLAFDWNYHEVVQFEKSNLGFDDFAWDRGNMHYAMLALDLDGDGRDDLLYRKAVYRPRCLPDGLAGPSGVCARYQTVDEVEWLYRLSTRDAGGRPVFGEARKAGLPRQYETLANPMPLPRTVDIDMDGRMDIVMPFPGAGLYDPLARAGSAPYWRVYRWSAATQRLEPDRAEPDPEILGHVGPFPRCGDLSVIVGTWTVPPCNLWPVPLYVADLDGDGLPELVRPYRDSPLGDGRAYWAYRPNAAGGLAARYSPLSFDRASYTLDLDAGRYLVPWNAYAAPLDGTATTHLIHRGQAKNESGTIYTSTRYHASSVVRGARKTVVTSLLGGTTDSSGFHYLFADLDGDGLPDALRVPNRGGFPKVAFNTGNGFAAPVAATISLPSEYRFGAIDERTPDPGIRIADFDQDGRQDLLVLNSKVPSWEGGSDARYAPLVYRGTGAVAPGAPLDPVFCLPYRIADASDSKPHCNFEKPFFVDGVGYPFTQILDVDGDGLPDIVQFENVGTRALRLYRNVSSKLDRITAIRTGLGHRIAVDYAPAAPARDDKAPGYPIYSKARGLWPVSRYMFQAGDGHYRVFPMRYEGGRLDLQGRGWLGFARRVVCDFQAKTRRESTYRNDVRVGSSYPYAFVAATEASVTYLTGAPAGDWRCEAPIAGVTRVEQRTANDHTTLGRGPGAPGAPQPFAVRLLEQTSTDHADGNELRSIRTSYSYTGDDFGELRSITKRGGGETRTVTYEYEDDADAWLLGLTKQVTEESRLDASRGGLVATRKTTLSHDPATGLTASTVFAPDGGRDLLLRTVFTRDEEGQVLAVSRQDSTGRSREEGVAFDSVDGTFATRFTNPAGHVRSVVVHPGLGVPVATRDENGVVVRFKYDGFGRPREVAAPDGANEQIDYEPGGYPRAYAVRRAVVGRGESVTTYDSLSLPVSVVADAFELGRTSRVETTYDPIFLDRVESVTRPYSDIASSVARTSHQRDELGRVIETTLPDGAKVTTEYEGLRRSTTRVVAGETRRHFVVEDELGRVVESGDEGVTSVDARAPHTVSTTFAFGPFDQPRSIVDSAGNAITASYDAAWLRRTKLVDPDMGVSSAEYDAFGDVEREVDGNGTVTTYGRDALGRAFVAANGRDGVACFAWDTAEHGLGRLAKTRSADDVSEENGYDALARPSVRTLQIGGERFSIDYGYDAVGRLDLLRYPEVGASRFAIRYHYARNGALARITPDSDPKRPLWLAERRAPDGQIEVEWFGNRVSAERRYDGRGLLEQSEVRSDTKSLLAIRYRYDEAGNVRARDDELAKRTERFTYDALDRLTGWKGSFGWPKALDVTYEYDDLHNLRARKSGAGTVTFTPDADHPHGVGTSSLGAYHYDSAGDQDKAPGRSVAYTGFHLPKKIVRDGLGEVSFAYDASHRRARKSSAGSEEVTYVGNLYERRRAAGASTHLFFVRAEERIVAVARWGETGAGVTKEPFSFVHADHVGSTRMRTDADGAIAERAAFEPFGGRVDPDDPTAPAPRASIDIGFTGHRHDDELELVDMVGRIYDPKQARFLTADPLVGDAGRSLAYNRYAYVWNNPLNRVDPSGFKGRAVVHTLSDDHTQTGLVPDPRREKPGKAESDTGEGGTKSDDNGSGGVRVAQPKGGGSSPPDPAAGPPGGGLGGTGGDPPPTSGGKVDDGSGAGDGDGGGAAPRARHAGKGGNGLPFGLGIIERDVSRVTVAALASAVAIAMVVDPFALLTAVCSAPATVFIGAEGVAVWQAATSPAVTQGLASATNGLSQMGGGGGEIVANASNYRELFVRFSGVNPGAAVQAHHTIPQKYEAVVKELYGINIHEPRFLAWWESVDHAKNARQYNDAVAAILESRPTWDAFRSEIHHLGEIYGFNVLF